MFRRTALIALVLAAGCFRGPASPTAADGRPFELRPGATATLPDGARLRFERVAEDSRCPIDAVCVWAGDATVAISVLRSGSGAESHELHTADPEGSQVVYPHYVIRLTELTPSPRASQRIPAAGYVATFIVSVR